jgi:hypothetical protein
MLCSRRRFAELFSYYAVHSYERDNAKRAGPKGLRNQMAIVPMASQSKIPKLPIAALDSEYGLLSSLRLVNSYSLSN